MRESRKTPKTYLLDPIEAVDRDTNRTEFFISKGHHNPFDLIECLIVMFPKDSAYFRRLKHCGHVTSFVRHETYRSMPHAPGRTIFKKIDTETDDTRGAFPATVFYAKEFDEMIEAQKVAEAERKRLAEVERLRVLEEIKNRKWYRRAWNYLKQFFTAPF